MACLANVQVMTFGTSRKKENKIKYTFLPSLVYILCQELKNILPFHLYFNKSQFDMLFNSAVNE